MSDTPTEEQRKHIYAVADAIETYPQKFDMDFFAKFEYDHKPEIRNGRIDYGTPQVSQIIWDGVELNCGTAHCIAGWSGVLAGAVSDDASRNCYSVPAARRMGMSPVHASVIFYPETETHDTDAPFYATFLRYGADHGWDSAISRYLDSEGVEA